MFGYYEENGLRLYAAEKDRLIGIVYNLHEEWYAEYTFWRDGDSFTDAVMNESNGYAEGPYHTLDDMEVAYLNGEGQLNGAIYRAIERAKLHGER